MLGVVIGAIIGAFAVLIGSFVGAYLGSFNSHKYTILREEYNMLLEKAELIITLLHKSYLFADLKNKSSKTMDKHLDDFNTCGIQGLVIIPLYFHDAFMDFEKFIKVIAGSCEIDAVYDLKTSIVDKITKQVKEGREELEKSKKYFM